MEQQEKKLIENLFYRLANSEKNDLNRDILADDLIKDLLITQPNAPYYMAQTILVQETAIKKLNEKINKLEDKISLAVKQSENKKSTSSFLSGLFGSTNSAKKYKKSDDNSDVSSNFQNNNQSVPNNITRTVSSNTSPINSSNSHYPTTGASNNGNSFLSGALQTATGVAGGMVMANMLTHLFEHKNPGEEIFNHTNNAHVNPDIVVEREIHDHYIHEDNHVEDNLSDDIHHNHDNYHDDNQHENYDDSSINDISSDDDNFI